MKPRITIIDYGAGNLRSVVNAMRRLGYDYAVTSDGKALPPAEVVIMPGVGAAADTMRALEKLGLTQPLRERIGAGRPFLGICLGLQVLFQQTEEDDGYPCLGVYPGAVRRLPDGNKIPHMGWNQVRQRREHPVFDGIEDGANFYFVHSYYVDPADASLVLGETDYGLSFCSVIARGNIVATQFHPEKSGEDGLRFYDNYIKWVASC